MTSVAEWAAGKLDEPEPRRYPGQVDAWPELEVQRARPDGTRSLFEPPPGHSTPANTRGIVQEEIN